MSAKAGLGIGTGRPAHALIIGAVPSCKGVPLQRPTSDTRSCGVAGQRAAIADADQHASSHAS